MRTFPTIESFLPWTRLSPENPRRSFRSGKSRIGGPFAKRAWNCSSARKNLRVALTLCLALLNLEGASGLREGFASLKGMLERHRPDLYPKLDPEDNNDPLERINVLASLSTPLGTFGDPMKFLQRLRQIPLANSAQMGRLNLAEIAGDKILLLEGGEKPPVFAAQVKAVFRDTSTEELAATAQAISDSIAFAKDIHNFLTTTVGTDRAPDMDAFVASSSEIEKCLLPTCQRASGRSPSKARQKPRPTHKRGRSRERSHTSREDVVRALDRTANTTRALSPRVPFLSCCDGRSGLQKWISFKSLTN